ncbi:MAG TPA: acetyl-CoA carboxylase biotin carboxyl carrier protein subunit [Candidatus Kapabacteria bacterium]|nr:acetyl-CoA carboxylase biotin carboxyl carrier protein subunit [Candidatus Kapabacteria bacterium]
MENLTISVNNKDFNVNYDNKNDNNIKIGDNEYEIKILKQISSNVYSVMVNNQIQHIEFNENNNNLTINLNGFSYDVEIKDSTRELLQKFINNNVKANAANAGVIKSPMPGLIIKIFTQIGMQVSAGDKLLIIEAMKMENLIKSNINGIVKEIKVSEGSAVDKDKVLITIEPN